MTDEEKKAYDNLIMLKYFTQENEDKKAIQIILNLIEKQSKEIEELKNTETYKLAIIDKDNYISKDKIKAKIEEYENKIKKIRSKKLINEPEDTIIITRYAHYISVLQSLLEKE